jgi:hypothetical protein
MKWSYWTILFSLYFGLSGFSHAEKVAGKTVVLQTKVIEQLEYDGSPGKTRINGSPLLGTKQTKSFELEGIWHCLGYVTSRKSFLLVGQFQEGAWVPLTKIKYLSEDDFKITDSKYKYNYPKNQKQPAGWEALAVVPGENLRYVAFVGNLDWGKTQLMVLDTEKDLIKILGDPPAPPPITDSALKKEAQKQVQGKWGWDSLLVGGYTQMDKGIITFKDGVIYASYGKDTVLKRAKKRTVKSWKLNF